MKTEFARFGDAFNRIIKGILYNNEHREKQDVLCTHNIIYAPLFIIKASYKAEDT